MNTKTEKLLPAVALVGMFLSGAASAQGYESIWEQRAEALRGAEVIETQAAIAETTAYYLENAKELYQKAMDLEKAIAMESKSSSTIWYYGG